MGLEKFINVYPNGDNSTSRNLFENHIHTLQVQLM